MSSVIDTRLLRHPGDSEIGLLNDHVQSTCKCYQYSWCCLDRACAECHRAVGIGEVRRHKSLELRAEDACEGQSHHGCEIWRLLNEEYEPRQRRKFQTMHCVILRVQLKEPSGKDVDGFDYEEHGGKTIPDEMLEATVIAGIDNSTVAQHLALNS